MQQFIDESYFDFPPTKRLRSSRPQISHGRLNEKRPQLPSPRATNPSSTDNIASSSSIPHEAKPKQPTQSFRDRLRPLAKRRAHASPDSIPTAHREPRLKPSVAPFFQRIETAFQAGVKPPSSNHATTIAHGPPRSPSPSPDDLIKQLKGPSSHLSPPLPFN